MIARLVSLPIARATASERVRSGAVIVTGALAALFAAVLQGGADAEIIRGFSKLMLGIFACAVGAGLLSDELENGHAQLVLLRPVTRAAWVGGRLAGASMVMLAGVVLAWALQAATSVSDGGQLFSAARLAALPLTFVWCLAVLATLLVLSAVLRGWTNVGALLVASLAWLALRGALSLSATALVAAQRPSTLLSALAQAASALDPYLGPQDSTSALVAIASRSTPDLTPALWNLVWFAGCWLGAVLLLNRRELGRRL